MRIDKKTEEKKLKYKLQEQVWKEIGDTGSGELSESRLFQLQQQIPNDSIDDFLDKFYFAVEDKDIVIH
ncbi:MAG TPA: hypothetical protein VK945_00895 [Planococcus sp. (in: firmicutes)]|nr:hypothetical protein [Planococcus sp. (in: firmicutes)]